MCHKVYSNVTLTEITFVYVNKWDSVSFVREKTAVIAVISVIHLCAIVDSR